MKETVITIELLESTYGRAIVESLEVSFDDDNNVRLEITPENGTTDVICFDVHNGLRIVVEGIMLTGDDNHEGNVMNQSVQYKAIGMDLRGEHIAHDKKSNPLDMCEICSFYRDGAVVIDITATLPHDLDCEYGNDGITSYHTTQMIMLISDFKTFITHLHSNFNKYYAKKSKLIIETPEVLDDRKDG